MKQMNLYPVRYMPSTVRQSGNRNFGALLEGTFLGIVFFILVLGKGNPTVRNLATVFAGIILEAMPFMLLGSLAGGLIEVFISREKILDLLAGKQRKVVFLAAALGLMLPICECAIVPVVKRLMKKGIPFSAAIAFLLGAPLVNPVVALSTAAAYSFDGSAVVLRLLTGYTIAVTAGLGMGWLFPGQAALREVGREREHPADCTCCGHDHEPEAPRSLRAKVATALRHASSDFFDVVHFLVMGAFIAALCQTLIARHGLAGFSSSPVMAIGLMMLLAVALNICSAADAFIAASFRNILPFSAQLAFMLLGPMLDLKLLFMYTGIFKRRAIAALTLALVLTVFLIAWGLQTLQPGILR
jgi:uncharacterized protein